MSISADVASQQLQLIQSDTFYETLVQLGCKKSAKDVPNLSQLLRLNQESTGKFIVDKLLQLIEVFIRDNYLQSFGQRKIHFYLKEENGQKDKKVKQQGKPKSVAANVIKEEEDESLDDE